MAILPAAAAPVAPGVACPLRLLRERWRGYPNNSDQEVRFLNDQHSGQVVGTLLGSSPQVGFLYSTGNVTDLNTLIDPALGWHLTEATGINDFARSLALVRTRTASQMHFCSPRSRASVVYPLALVIVLMGDESNGAGSAISFLMTDMHRQMR